MQGIRCKNLHFIFQTMPVHRGKDSSAGTEVPPLVIPDVIYRGSIFPLPIT